MKNLPPGPFDLILCDPPLYFDTWSDKGDGRSPQRKYRCMSLSELLAMPVAEIAAPNAILAMWVYRSASAGYARTDYRLGLQLRRQRITWVKVNAEGKLRFGTGYYTRKCAEHVSAPARQGTQAPAVYTK